VNDPLLSALNSAAEFSPLSYGTYEFAFLSPEEAMETNGKQWFPANKILGFKSPKEVNSYLASMKLANNEFAYGALFDFYQRITESANAGQFWIHGEVANLRQFRAADCLLPIEEGSADILRFRKQIHFRPGGRTSMAPQGFAPWSLRLHG